MNLVLIFSSTFFILPFLYIYVINKNKQNSYSEKYLSILLLFNLLLSILFWCNPIKFSTIHYIDSFFVKLSVFCIFIYITFIKNLDYYYKLIFYGLYLIFISFAMLSNDSSTKEWCSNDHIFSHFLMHVVGISGSYIAFI